MSSSNLTNLIEVTNSDTTLDLSSTTVTTGYAGFTFSETLSGYTPISWNYKLNSWSSAANINVEKVSISSDSISISGYGTPIFSDGKRSYTITFYVTWLKNI